MESPGLRKINVFKFSVLHKGLKVFLFSACPDCFWLVNGKSFHKPPEFLAAQESGFGGVPGPLEPAGTVQPFLEQDKPVFIKMESFQLPAVFSTEEINRVRVRVQFVDVTDDRHEAVKAFSHICPSGDHVDF